MKITGDRWVLVCELSDRGRRVEQLLPPWDDSRDRQAFAEYAIGALTDAFALGQQPLSAATWYIRQPRIAPLPIPA